jgi:hypothetical protein
MASPIMTTPPTNDAYATFPCAYLVLEEDEMLPRQYQEGMIAAQSQKSGNQFTIYYCPASDAPYLSWTEGLARTIEEFMKRAAVIST